MRVTVIFGVALLCAGCAFHKNMDKEVGALVGKDIGVAIKRLGYPSNKLSVAGDTVYVWDNDCVLRIGTDASNRIVRADWEGSRRHCSEYYDALDEDDTDPSPMPQTARH